MALEKKKKREKGESKKKNKHRRFTLSLAFPLLSPANRSRQF
jgi:hypothetical protein